MSHLHQDVIVDLLPLYASGDASDATRAVVDAYCQAHPEFEATMRAALASTPLVPGKAAGDGGIGTLRRVRAHLRWRAVLIATGIFCTLTPMSFVYQNGQLTNLMWRDSPAVAIAFGMGAMLAWGALAILIRRTDQP